MDRSYVRMLAVSGYQSLMLDDIHNAMQSPTFQRQPTVLRLSLSRERSRLSAPRPGYHSAINPQNQEPHQGNPQVFTTRGKAGRSAPGAVEVKDKPSVLTTPQERLLTATSQATTMKVPPTHRQMVLWVYTEPSKLHLIKITKSNPVAKLKDYIESNLKLEEDSYTLANLAPKATYPVPLMKFSSDLDNGIILCLPTKNQQMVIQHDDNKLTFTVQINPLQTVRDLKMLICKVKGYPLQQQDLLYNSHVLQNHQQILEYQIKAKSHIHLVVQPAKPITVQVDTFWGEKYQIEIQSSMLTGDLLHKVLKKTYDDGEVADADLENVSTYGELLMMQYKDRFLDNEHCLSYYGVRGGVTIKLLATGNVRHDDHRNLTVLAEDEEEMVVSGAPYDTWFIIALKAHGHLKVPINKMSLYVNDKKPDSHGLLSDVELDDNYVHVRIINDKPRHSFEIHELYLVEVKLPSGRIHSVTCYGKDHISKIKESIEAAGFPNAHMYELLYKRVRLPSNSKIIDYKFPERVEMELKLYEFPIHLAQAHKVVKLNVECDKPMSELIKKISEKLSCSPIKTALVHSGHDLYNIPPSLIRNTGLFINSKIHVETVQAIQTTHLVTDNEVMPLPTKQTIDPLHFKQLAVTCHDVECFLESFQWFMKWRNPEQSRFMDRLSPDRRSKLKLSQESGGLHQALQAVRDELRSQQGTRSKELRPKAANPINTDNKLLNRFLEDLPTAAVQKVTLHKTNTKLPTIHNRQNTTSAKSSTSTRQSAKSRETATSPRRATINETEPTNNRKKRSVRFDVPEGMGERSKTGFVGIAFSGSRPKGVWQDSRKYLDKQSKQSNGTTPILTRATTEMEGFKSKYTPYRSFETFPIPKWHQSQMSMNPNFTNNIALNGNSLSTISVKQTSTGQTM